MNDLCHFEPTESTTSPQQTEGWIVFRESPEAVFACLTDHAALGKWVPFVQEVTVTHPHPVGYGESVVGTTCAIAITGGLSIVEKVV